MRYNLIEQKLPANLFAVALCDLDGSKVNDRLAPPFPAPKPKLRKK